MATFEELLKALQPAPTGQPDIYPLGLGGPGTTGLLKDIVNFALNNAKQFADRLPSPDTASATNVASNVNPVMNLVGMLSQGGKFFHGTPKVFKEFDPALSKSSGLVGPGHAYLTNNPQVAESYAAGATHGIGATPSLEEALAAGMQPNIRPYQVAPHNTFATAEPLPQQDLDMLMRTLRETLGTPQPGSFQKGGGASRAENVKQAVQAKAGGFGQEVFDTLQNMLGPDRTNEVLKKAGFSSITYPGGAVTGSTPHQAINVLDPSIMQNLFEAMAKTTR